MISRLLLVIFIAFSLQACESDSEEKFELRSPCVSAGYKGGNIPCERRRVNDNWLG